MIIETVTGVDIDDKVLYKYFKNLVNLFFKILPMKENEEDTLDVYLRTLQVELLGCKNLIIVLDNDPRMLSLISILQYLIDFPECSLHNVRREVFHAISICNKMKSLYCNYSKEVSG